MIRRAATAAATFFLATACFAQEGGAPAAGDPTPAAGSVLAGKQAFGDWQADRPGVRRLIRPQDLPKPHATSSAVNGPERVARPQDASPEVPPGFSAELVASGLRSPRAVRVAPNGDIFVADSRTGRILAFRLGKDGAEIRTRGAEAVHVPVAGEVEGIDPTGVGDAFRAGFLVGLAGGLSHERCAQIGSVLAAYVLETVGTQEYTVGRGGFLERVTAAYGAEAAAEIAPHVRTARD